jgi:hypothetical protein
MLAGGKGTKQKHRFKPRFAHKSNETQTRRDQRATPRPARHRRHHSAPRGTHAHRSAHSTGRHQQAGRRHTTTGSRHTQRRQAGTQPEPAIRQHPTTTTGTGRHTRNSESEISKFRNFQRTEFQNSTTFSERNFRIPQLFQSGKNKFRRIFRGGKKQITKRNSDATQEQEPHLNRQKIGRAPGTKTTQKTQRNFKIPNRISHRNFKIQTGQHSPHRHTHHPTTPPTPPTHATPHSEG